MMASTNVTSLLFGRETGLFGRASSTTVREREKSLQEWVTKEASQHCLSECCILNNTPRSTIAATINRDGSLIASTHGDHTVKLVNFQTGEFVKELTGHRRTPWTVTDISQCLIQGCMFVQVKFHPLHPNLLVSGSLDFKIKLWDTDDGLCLQTRDFERQISSVSFHPTGKALAIAAGHSLYVWTYNEEEGRFSDEASCIFHTVRTIRTVHFDPVGDMIMVSVRVEQPSVPQEAPRPISRSSDYGPPWTDQPQPWRGMHPIRGGSMGYPRDHGYGSSQEAAQHHLAPETRISDAILRQMGGPYPPPMLGFPSLDILPTFQRAGPAEEGQSRFPDSYRLPGEMQAYPSAASARLRSNPRPLHIAHPQTLPVLSLMPTSHESHRHGQANEPTFIPPTVWNLQHPNPMVPVAPSSTNDMPHLTKLFLYKFDIDRPHAYLSQEYLRMDNAVICSEMGAHISPCGRMLVVCVASPCMDRRVPTIPAYVYELRVISLEKNCFGQVLRSRSISAGHCLTSVQFSPGSDMILLSYGKKHASLLRCLELNGATVAQIHTLLELYSAKTLALVRVVHSAEDEANTASFHPFAGEGIVYGTKNGKLQILRHARAHSNGDGGEIKYENELLEVLEDELQ